MRTHIALLWIITIFSAGLAPCLVICIALSFPPAWADVTTAEPSTSGGATTPAPTPTRKFKKTKKSVSAAPEAAAPIPDGDSCGLGWQVTDKRTISAVITRATTNFTIPPTFGMTSGTIGCKQLPLSQRETKGAMYAYNNRDALLVEMAEGDGEFLRGFAESIGCTDATYPRFSHLMHSHYRSITRDGAANGLELFDGVRKAVTQDPLLAVSCPNA